MANEKEPPIDAQRARELLKRERVRIEEALAGTERARKEELGEIQDETAPEADAGLIHEEQVDDAVTRSLRLELEAVERAEKRLEGGTYGFSVESGEPIPPERLESIPWAERTKEEQERIGG